MELAMGEEVTKKFIRAFINEYKFKSITTADLTGFFTTYFLANNPFSQVQKFLAKVRIYQLHQEGQFEFERIGFNFSKGSLIEKSR